MVSYSRASPSLSKLLMLHAVLKTVSRAEANIEIIYSKLNKEDNKILKWLSALNPSSRHIESQQRRVEGTGRWMLEDPKFVQWSSKHQRVRHYVAMERQALAKRSFRE